MHYPQLLQNSIIYYNQSPFGVDNGFFGGGSLRYCCSIPLPNGSVGSITNEPAFVDLANGDLRLQSNSPCINGGQNLSVFVSSDLDGNPRIAGGTVDIGAYEFQSPVSTIPYAWLLQHGLTANDSTDTGDPDGDGLNNWQEWRTGTDPTNAASVLRLLSSTNSTSGVAVTWQSVSGKTYFLERAANLGPQPPFLPLATNIVGTTGTTTYTDTNAVSFVSLFYRVGVE